MEHSAAARPLVACVLGSLAIVLGGCATSYPAAPFGMGMGATSTAPAPVVPARFNAAERDFATRAAAKGMYEVEVSRLAADRAINPGVRSYAQAMVVHHTQANKELVALMSARGVAPPKGLAADRATKLHRLASLPPSAAFDHGYVKVVGVEDHRTNIAAFERARRDVNDRDLKAWIDRMLSVMRGHLATAESLSATLAG
jgi:putative membrane protein